MVHSRYVINMYRVIFPSQGPGREIRFFKKKNAFVALWVEHWNAAALHGRLAIHICELSSTPAMDSKSLGISKIRKTNNNPLKSGLPVDKNVRLTGDLL